MNKKTQKNVSKSFLQNVNAPIHGESYSLITHKFIMDYTNKLLDQSNFTIIDESYKSNYNGDIAQGIYKIKPQISNTFYDDEMGLMFAWTNSYNKQLRFRCAIGAYVFVCNNGIVSGEMSYARKHIGRADSDVVLQIGSQINNARTVFDAIKNSRDSFKKINLSFKEQAEIVGRLYLEEDIITSSHINIIKNEMNNPSYNYNVDQDNVWAFYNHVTHAMKTIHPKKWLSNSRKFHEFMTAEFLSNSKYNNSDAPDFIDNLDIVDIDMSDKSISIDSLAL